MIVLCILLYLMKIKEVWRKGSVIQDQFKYHPNYQ